VSCPHSGRITEAVERCKDLALPLTVRHVGESLARKRRVQLPGDATFDQRIEMMHLQALDMEERRAAAQAVGEDSSCKNVAVAALNHPTFVGKSDILLRWFRERRMAELGFKNADETPSIRLTFLIGTDTLTRLFIPKYYEPSSTLGRNMSDHLRKFFTTDNSDIVNLLSTCKPQLATLNPRPSILGALDKGFLLCAGLR
jgi:hypothetical protein